MIILICIICDLSKSGEESFNIAAKSDIEIKSISVCDVLGQLVIAVSNAQKVLSIDVSTLPIGNYILK